MIAVLPYRAMPFSRRTSHVLNIVAEQHVRLSEQV
jgi:hypothetical protein